MFFKSLKFQPIISWNARLRVTFLLEQTKIDHKTKHKCLKSVLAHTVTAECSLTSWSVKIPVCVNIQRCDGFLANRGCCNGGVSKIKTKNQHELLTLEQRYIGKVHSDVKKTQTNKQNFVIFKLLSWLWTKRQNPEMYWLPNRFCFGNMEITLEDRLLECFVFLEAKYNLSLHPSNWLPALPRHPTAWCKGPAASCCSPDFCFLSACHSTWASCWPPTPSSWKGCSALGPHPPSPLLHLPLLPGDTSWA